MLAIQFSKINSDMKEMRGINLIVLFAALTSFSYLDSINGLWILPFPRFHSGYNPQTSEQINSEDDFNEIAPEPLFPFPAFWNNFRPRTVNYLKDMSKEAKDKERMAEEIKDVKTINTPFLEQNFETVSFEEQKVDGSFHGKISNVTGNITEQIFTTAAPHYVKMKFNERLSKPSFFDRMFHPLVRISRFRYINSRRSKNHERLEKEEKEAEKQNTSGIYHLNDTEVAMQNSSMTKEEENRQKLYFVAWITVKTPAVLDILMLLSLLFVLLGMLLGCFHNSKKQSKKDIQFRKRQPYR